MQETGQAVPWCHGGLGGERGCKDSGLGRGCRNKVRKQPPLRPATCRQPSQGPEPQDRTIPHDSSFPQNLELATQDRPHMRNPGPTDERPDLRSCSHQQPVDPGLHALLTPRPCSVTPHLIMDCSDSPGVPLDFQEQWSCPASCLRGSHKA